MVHLTLLVAVIFCVMVLIVRPVNAVGVYIASLIWYPNYMMVSIGTIDISLGRFVVSVFFLRCLMDSKITSRRPAWCGLDSVVVASMIAFTLPFFVTHPAGQALENRAGFLMDTLLAYAVIRMVLTDYGQMIKLFKIVSLLLVPLAVVGVVESVTGIRPFGVMLDRAGLLSFVSTSEMRLGLFRAIGPFSHAILFGCTFGLFFPLIYFLRHETGSWRHYSILLSCIAIVGVMSSMSSGPWVMLGVTVVCLCMERAKIWIKATILFLIILLVMAEILSNRPIHHVIASYANPLGGSGWHRAKLIDLAIEHVDEWWLVGYGLEDPGWGESLGMLTTDITNEFILAAVRYGLWGPVALTAILAAVFRYLFRVYQKTNCRQIKSLAWAFGGMMVAMIVSWMSVSFFGQLIPLLYCMLGMIGAFHGFSRRRNYYYLPQPSNQSAMVETGGRTNPSFREKKYQSITG